MTTDVKNKSTAKLKKTATAADILVDRLIAWDVNVIFGLPGDGINGIMEALRKRKNKIRFVQVRHEEAAALMACGYAKFTGKLGVCIATTGPGAVHLLNGLYDAKMDNAPVLAITGQTYHDLIGAFYQQEIDLINLFKDVTVYNQMCTGANHVKMLADEACRSALSLKQVSHLTFPIDIQNQKITRDKPSVKKVKGHTTSVFQEPVIVPQKELLVAAAKILNKGKKIAILAGQGALNCHKELIKLSQLLKAPIVKSLLGKATIPDDSPCTTGGIGLLGSLASQKVLEECDTLFIIGSNFPYLEYYPKINQAKAVQIDIHPERLGLRYPIDVGLTGYAKETLQELIPLLKKNSDSSFLTRAQKYKKAWLKELEKRASIEQPLKPQKVISVLNTLLAKNAIITSDSGSNTFWAAQYIQIKEKQLFNNTGLLATMAAGLPYIIAAQLAYPKRQCVCIIGDGGFTMLMGEFITAVKYKLPITVIVIKNNEFEMIKMEQQVMLGNPKYGIELQDMDFVKFAESCGGVGFRCAKSDEIAPAIKAALASKKPAIVEAVVDPNELPLPPTLTKEQIKNIKKYFG